MPDTAAQPEPSHPAHAHVHGCGAAHDRAADSLAEHHEQRDAICIERLSFSYQGSVSERNGSPSGRPMALRDVTLHIERGTNLGIIGPNGAGKTTLLKIILGLLEGYSGDVSIMGLTPRQACRQGRIIGYVPQRHDINWRFPVSVRQAVLMGLSGKTGLFRWYGRDDRDYAGHLMQRVGIADLADRPIGELSGGQQQRMFIARALVSRPPILIFDEPLVGVDEVGQRRFAELVHELHETLKLTLIMVSHDLQAIAAGCNRVACLNQTIHYHDAPQGLTPQVLAEVFEHEIRPVLERSSPA